MTTQTQTYHIAGMTCNGCRTDVDNKLNAMPQVSNATVNLANEEAVIQSDKPVTAAQLQQVLPAKYTVTQLVTLDKIGEEHAFAKPAYQTDRAEQPQSKLQQLKPLFMILGYISIASVLLHRADWNWQEMMLDFMGLFYIVFSFFKLLDLKGFPVSFSMYDPLAKVLPVYAWIYPFLETALGLLFLLRFQIPVALVVTIIILSVTTVGVTKTLLDKKAITCACLGTGLKLPMTEATFIENAIMIAMAVTMLFHIGF